MKNNLKLFKRISDIQVLLLIFVVAFLMYFPSFSVFYTNDDFFHLKIARVATFTDYIHFFNPFSGPEGLGLYRPLTTQGFYSLAWLFNLNPLPLHIVSFLAFFGILFLIYKLSLLFGLSTRIALICVFLYAVSSTHFAHFYYLGTFQEVGMTLFSLASVWFFVKYFFEKNFKLYLYSFIAFILALFSKETAVVIPFLAVLTVSFLWLKDMKIAVLKKYSEQFIKMNVKLFPYYLVLMVYFYLRIFHYGFASGDSYVWDFSLTRIPNSLFWFSLWSLNIPEMFVDFIGPGVHINPNLFRYWSQQVVPILILFGLQVVFLIYLVLKTFRRHNREICRIGIFCFFWFTITLVPVVFLPLHKFTYYLTLPLVAAVIMISWLIERSRVSVYLLSLFLIFYLSQSILTLTLTKETHWITQGEKTAERVYDTIEANKSNYLGKTLVFVDTAGDSDLPWSPTDVLKDVLSNENFFKVFYDNKIHVSYGSATADNDVVVLPARQFLGY